jgi:hypothetical protein
MGVLHRYRMSDEAGSIPLISWSPWAVTEEGEQHADRLLRHADTFETLQETATSLSPALPWPTPRVACGASKSAKWSPHLTSASQLRRIALFPMKSLQMFGPSYRCSCARRIVDRRLSSAGSHKKALYVFRVGVHDQS